MSESRLTILGLYEHGNMINDDLFSNMKLPDGIDFETVRDQILEQGAAFEILYPEYDYMKFSIGIWSKKHYWTFKKWYDLMQIEYDPLYNYNRFENWQDSGQDTAFKNIADKGNETETTDRHVDDLVHGTTDTTDKVNTEGSEELSVTAYNADAYRNKEKHEREEKSTATGHSETTTTGTTDELINRNKSNREDIAQTDDSINNSQHTGHMFGNIGVMSTQDMYIQEWNVAKLNIIQHIVDLFLEEFCLLVY